MEAELEIRSVDDAADPDALMLIAASDAYLRKRYPPESNHAEPLAALVGRGSSFFLGYVGTKCVACGAVKQCFDEAPYAEIKRLFVVEEYRGRRLAAAMMRHLEAYSLERNLLVARLEAGPLQPEALGLYRKMGYRERGPFGSYAADPLSVFMEKRLSR